MFRIVTNSPHRSITHVILDSIGITLATNTSYRVHNRPERIMNVFLLIISVLTSRIITIVVYNLMVASSIDSGPDTLQELNDMDIPVYISDDMNAISDGWSDNIP